MAIFCNFLGVFQKGPGMWKLVPSGLEEGIAALKVLKRGLLGHQMVL